MGKKYKLIALAALFSLNTPIINAQLLPYQGPIELYSPTTKIRPVPVEKQKIIVSVRREISPLLDRINHLFDRYDQLPKTKSYKTKREEFLLGIKRRYPKAAFFLKEEGDALVDKKLVDEGLKAYRRAQLLEPNNPDIAIQIADILEEKKEYGEAYQQFEIAQYSKNPEISLRSKKTLAELGELRFKYLPDPYFSDLYFEPLYFSKFNQIIIPLKFRIGRTYGNHQQFATYAFFSIDYTNLDENSALPQIYGSNLVIVGGGATYRVFTNIPLYLYVETGPSYNMSSRNWRYYVNPGIFYENYWGPDPTYSPHFKFVFKPLIQNYDEFSYYNVFDNNWFGSIDLRVGFQFLEYKYSSLDLFGVGLLTFDVRGEPSNNIALYGVGIGFVPYNRFNFIFRVAEVRETLLKGTEGLDFNESSFWTTIAEGELYLVF